MSNTAIAPSWLTGRLSVAVALCVMPLLLLPSVIPASLRVAVVSVLALLIFAGATAIFFARESTSRWRVAAFCLAASSGWLRSTWETPASIAHFGGLAAAILLMAVLVTLVTTDGRLLLASMCVSVASIVVLAAGLAGMEAPPSKFLVIVGPAADKIRQFDTSSLPTLDYGWLGVRGGHVNPNALGGTALMLLPLCLGGWAAGKRGQSRSLRYVSGIAVAGCVMAVILSASRTAIYGTFLLGLLFSVWYWRPFRKAIALACIALAAAVACWLAFQGPELLKEVTTTQAIHSLDTRLSVWRPAALSLLKHPVLGVGISNSNALAGSDSNGPTGTVEVHAHNQFLQVALDLGIAGLAAYLLLFGWAVRAGLQRARQSDAAAPVLCGAAFSIVAIHIFGLVDAIALGSKVGIFQWWAAGLILTQRGAAPVVATDTATLGRFHGFSKTE